MNTSSQSPCLKCSPARERRDVAAGLRACRPDGRRQAGTHAATPFIPPLRRRATGRWALAMICAAPFSASIRAAEDIFDQIESALTWSAVDDRFRGRLSGTLDLEGYSFPQPAPMLPLRISVLSR